MRQFLQLLGIENHPPLEVLSWVAGIASFCGFLLNEVLGIARKLIREERTSRRSIFLLAFTVLIGTIIAIWYSATGPSAIAPAVAGILVGVLATLIYRRVGSNLGSPTIELVPDRLPQPERELPTSGSHVDPPTTVTPKGDTWIKWAVGEPPVLNCPGRDIIIQHFWRTVTGRDSRRILMIVAPTNFGKSKLREAMAEAARATEGLRVAEAEFVGTSEVDPMVKTLATKLQNQGLDFSAYMEAQHQVANVQGLGDENTRAQFLASLRRNRCPIVLFIDVFEKATEVAQYWISGALLSTVVDHAGLCIVLLGQKIPQDEGRAWEPYTRRMEAGPVKNFSVWSEFFARQPHLSRIPETDLQRIVARSRGVPGEVFLAVWNFQRKRRSQGDDLKD